MREIRVFKSDDYRYVGTYEDGVFQQGFYEKADGDFPVEGDIYLGRVESMDRGRKNAFVDIKCGKNAILPLYKKSEIKIGDILPFEVIRGEKDQKGAKVSLSYTVPGRYVILRDAHKKISISRSMNKSDIKDEYWEQLKAFSKDFQGQVSVRSNIKSCMCSSDLEADLDACKAAFMNVKKKGAHSTVLGKIHSAGGILGRISRSESNVTEIIKAGEGHWEEGYKIGDFLCDIMKAYDREVELPAGGSMVIDRGEALYSIDINSGANFHRDVNNENAEFICREILKRNINGLIIIDFINFKDKDKIDPLAAKISEIMNRDSIKGEVYYNKELGIVEIARNRKGLTLYEVLDDIKKGTFKCTRVIKEKESKKIIGGMIKNVCKALEQEQNKYKSRLVIKLHPHFQGEVEEMVDKMRETALGKNLFLTLSYNDEYYIGYSNF